MSLNGNTLQLEINKGIKLIETNNFSEAEKLFLELKNNPQTRLTGLFFLGIIRIKKKENLKAKEIFFEIISIDKSHVDANFNLGLIFFSEKNFKEALFYFDLVTKINNKHLHAYYHIGLIYFINNNFDNALFFFEKCNKINSKFVPANLNLGNIFLRKKDFKKSIFFYSKVLEINPNEDVARFNISWCHFAQLNFKEGFEFYEARKKRIKTAKQLNEIKKTYSCNEWIGENLDNKTILILSEQGIGDNIQFFRYLFWLNNKYKVNIIFYIKKNLCHLFDKTQFKIVDNLDKNLKIDYFKLLLSLPGIYYEDNKSFQKVIPYIKSDTINDLKWKNKLSIYKKPLIALNWQGDKSFLFDKQRSIPLKFFENILKIEKYNFLSIQKGFGSEQIKKNNFEKYLVDLSSEIDNGVNAFEDTISILKNVNFLITSDTAIAHLSGTLGIKTYLLISDNPEWRWFVENKFKIFYPSIQIIQQKKGGDWEAVFNELKKIIDN